jgi:hypothetical protein
VLSKYEVTLLGLRPEPVKPERSHVSIIPNALAKGNRKAPGTETARRPGSSSSSQEGGLTRAAKE